MSASLLPTPPPPDSRDASRVEAWVSTHLGHLVEGDARASRRFRGGQTAADAALALLDIDGYRRQRNEVWPAHRRGASAVSPYVRHGLIDLPTLWAAVADAPSADRSKYRDELLWQEYARHWYARLGTATRHPTRNHVPVRTVDADPWDRAMACVDLVIGELEADGWIVNQTRMWMASHWAVRGGADWRAGEDRFFRHLLDGSRAANRLGWQWVSGAGSHKVYGFSRSQVENRAPGLCDGCELRDRCPIPSWPQDPGLSSVEPPPGLRSDADVEGTAGPTQPQVDGEPQVVWLTAESLGDADPALEAHPELPAVFVFDEALLAGLRLSGKRLAFLAETLGDLAQRRAVEVHLGDPVDVLAGRPLAATFTPVPGWRRRAAALDVVATHPWRWLAPPHAGSVTSFTAWRRRIER